MTADPQSFRGVARKLGDVLQFRNEIVHPKDNPTGIMTFVGLEHIQRETGIRTGSETVDLEQLTGRRARFQAGDIVYGYLRPYLNKVWIAEFGGICSVDQYVFKVRPIADRNYVYHFLRSPEFLKTAPIDTAPGQLPRIRSGEISATPIPLPPLDEQKRIAAILDKVDQLRQKRRQALALLDSLTQSIFLEMFGDPLSEASSFERFQMKEIAELINGDRSSNYPSQDDLVDSGILFLNTTNITDDGIDLDRCNFITAEKFKSLGRGKLKEGDIVITLRGSLGQAAIFDCGNDTGFINAQMMIIRTNHLVDQEYLLSFLKLDRMQKHFKKIGSGSAVPQLTGKQMSDLRVPLPPSELQVEFSRRISQLRVKRRLLKQGEQVLASLFSSLQHRAFSGQL
ncbi:restriction endonuclease subunit S [Rhizobium sp. NLR8a]|uniref:restriction endonuclease subunit S n=1 Tax=Rhizobium sp. NLR8a TaxID=2731119 RepID=UPI002180CACD|nr:restriction endonuclease subunit S [Rhizobium sp. NLR8a]